MSKRIAIIGGGWYGCHMASCLMQAGHCVKLYEAGNKIFSGASAKNQNRLHLGFHYPRDFATRKQSAEGYYWFKDHYSHLISKIENNYYGVSQNDSQLDFNTYKQILDGSKLSYITPIKSVIDLKNIEGIIQVEEMLIRNDLAQDYFEKILKSLINLNTPLNLSDGNVLNSLKKNFDYVLDCTWQTSKKIDHLEIYYEPCIYLYYQKKIKTNFALTIMDGKFVSLYPYKENIYTLTSVNDTPINKTKIYKEAVVKIMECNNKDFILKSIKKFEDKVNKYYPNFKKDFIYNGVEFSIKTKIKSGSDFRGTIIHTEDNYIAIFSGKIDTIHVAENKIFEIIS
jgi:hypothetical protein